ncbi:hypothetical protein GEMRC1_006683 [Eukaryota sp. GEM-RC1]
MCQQPLLSGQVYTWKFTYTGSPRDLFVGVIPSSKFNENDFCLFDAYGIFNHADEMVSVQGAKPAWSSGTTLTVTVDLFDTEQSSVHISNNIDIHVFGDLPPLHNDFYRPFSVFLIVIRRSHSLIDPIRKFLIIS